MEIELEKPSKRKRSQEEGDKVTEELPKLFTDVFENKDLRGEIFSKNHRTISWAIRTDRMNWIERRKLEFDDGVWKELQVHHDASLWKELVRSHPSKFETTQAVRCAMEMQSKEMLDWIGKRFSQDTMKMLWVQWVDLFELAIAKSPTWILDWFKSDNFKTSMGASIVAVSSRSMEIAIQNKRKEALTWLFKNTSVKPSPRCWLLAKEDSEIRSMLITKFSPPPELELQPNVGSPDLYSL